MHLLAYILGLAIDIYILIIIIQVIVGWLVIFDIVNANHPQAKNLMALLRKATDPIYNQLRKYIPSIGGIDITPLIVILGLSLLKNIVVGALYRI